MPLSLLTKTSGTTSQKTQKGCPVSVRKTKQLKHKVSFTQLRWSATATTCVLLRLLASSCCYGNHCDEPVRRHFAAQCKASATQSTQLCERALRRFMELGDWD